MFGPSLSVVGGNLGKWTDKWSANFLRITQRAEAKLGDAAGEPGEVNPRVARHAILDGAFSDDELVHEYYAGLVAGARSAEGENDDSIWALSLVSRLSSRALRAHYIAYRCVALSLHGGWQTFGTAGRGATAIVVPLSDLSAPLRLEPDRRGDDLAQMTGELVREGLLEATWAIGGEDSLKGIFPGDWLAPEQGWAVRPSWMGFSLALIAEGPGKVGLGNYLYGTGWDAVPGIDLRPENCVFPTAPTNSDALQQLREKAGHLFTLPDPGWFIRRVAGAHLT